MDSSLRLYVWVNFYLSSIQQGIQTAHVVHSLFTKYESSERGNVNSAWPTPGSSMLWDWAKDHKTIVVLNGGANADILEIMHTMEGLQHTCIGYMPFSGFNEDDMSLGNILTSVGVVVPKCYYDAQLSSDSEDYVYDQEGERIIYVPSSPEHRLISILKSCKLAR